MLLVPGLPEYNIRILIIMISREEIVKIGHFNKSHGIKGEVSFTFSNDSFIESEHPFLICEIDGIFIPFCMNECRFRSNSTVLVKLNGIDSDTQAKMFTNKDVYFLKHYINENIPENFYTWNYFIGYTLQDSLENPIGEIIAVDDTTINTLFVVNLDNDRELLIPVAEEIVKKTDNDKRIIQVEIPEGILNLDQYS